jgi:16S rRNA (cytidine1402-2'-O)-methyltransferase
MTKGKILLIPLPIGEKSAEQFITPFYLEIVKSTKFWVVENLRTTRRFLSSLQLGLEIDGLTFFELHRDFSVSDLHLFLKKHITLGDIGITSEAGLPGMADPGAVAVSWAHSNGVEVAPITGPGSVYLSLCASGFNGQQFVFHGYCPIKDDELDLFFKRIVRHQKETGYTQIFIETPYRNDRLLSYMIKSLPADLKVCIACNLQTPLQWIKTKSIADWKTAEIAIGKSPCVFLIGG